MYPHAQQDTQTSLFLPLPQTLPTRTHTVSWPWRWQNGPRWLGILAFAFKTPPHITQQNPVTLQVVIMPVLTMAQSPQPTSPTGGTIGTQSLTHNPLQARWYPPLIRLHISYWMSKGSCC